MARGSVEGRAGGEDQGRLSSPEALFRRLRVAGRTAVAYHRSARRKVRYSVAQSLDGFIADREGGYDWIVDEPAIDFQAFFARFDTVLMGRKSYEQVAESGLDQFRGMDVYVFSTTLDPAEHPDVIVVSRAAGDVVRALKARANDAPGPGDREPLDIWLWGGGELFGSLAAEGVVDTVEMAIIPVLLGDGIPVMPAGARRPPPGAGGPAGGPPADAPPGPLPDPLTLELLGVEEFPSGILLVKYGVVSEGHGGARPGPATST